MVHGLAFGYLPRVVHELSLGTDARHVAPLLAWQHDWLQRRLRQMHACVRSNVVTTRGGHEIFLSYAMYVPCMGKTFPRRW